MDKKAIHTYLFAIFGLSVDGVVNDRSFKVDFEPHQS